MCGYVAVLTPDRNFPEQVLRDMRDRMLHRGPDGDGEWIERMEEGSIALGHRRLAIIDLTPGGAQPMFSHNERYVLVYNGEIYNYIELKAELESQGYRFRSTSDSEVLLTAYEAWGEDFLIKLNGMYSFVIWDRKEKKLLCVRDRFGEKPLYYCRIPGGGLAIASEIKALFAHPAIQPEKDEATIQDYMKGIVSYSRPETFFKNVMRFPAGHAAIFDARGQEQKRWRYYCPDYSRRNEGISDKTLTDTFQEKLLTSLKMRLRSDVRVGACLSGGLDSSTLVGLLNRLEKEGLAKFSYTYSARFDNDPTISEGEYIDEMNKLTGFTSQSVTPMPSGLMEESQRLHWHQEQPFLSASMYLEWCVVRKARETGTTVLLDGQGADEVLGGYQYHLMESQSDDLLNGHWLSLAENTILFRQRLKKAAAKYKDSQRRIDMGLALDIPNIRSAIKNHWLGKISDKDRREGIPHEKGRSNYFRRQLANGLLYDTLPNNLHSGDSNGMAHSIETRFPYLDYDLVDWCTGLPDNILIRKGWLKYILRMASQGLIPDSIRWRADKVGFAAPQDEWIRHEMESWAMEKIFYGPISKLPYFDRDMLESAWKRHKDGEADTSWLLWKYLSLNEWLDLLENGTWKSGLSPKLTTLGRATA